MQDNRKHEAETVRMNADERRRTHRDFKTEIGGRKYVLRMGASGTALVPVVIEKEAKA